MKLKIKGIFAVMIASMLLLAGCGDSGFTALTGGPTSSDLAIGNGGNVVVKGDYLYFVNGYTDGSTLVAGDNEYNEQDKSAIYRTELDSNGNIVYDADGNIKDTELVIPKIVGFENGSFYIYGGKIYYTSPNTEKDTDGNDRFDWITFYSANLNGGEVTQLHTATTAIKRYEFEVYEYNSKIYIVTLEGGTLKIINTSDSSKNTIAENVGGVAFADYDEFDGDIYYSRQLNDSDNSVLENGNVFAKTDIAYPSEEILEKNGSTYTAKEYKNGAVYYNLMLKGGLNTCLYSREVSETEFTSSEEVRLSAVSYSDFLALDYQTGNSRGIIAAEDSKIYRITDIYSADGYEVIYEGDANLLFTQGQWVYFYTGDGEKSTIKRVNYETLELENITEENSSLKLDIDSKIDYDSNNIYYYVAYTNSNGTSYYLNTVNFMELGAEETQAGLVGVFMPEDVPEVEE